jgi:hypothetical protein
LHAHRIQYGSGAHGDVIGRAHRYRRPHAMQRGRRHDKATIRLDLDPHEGRGLGERGIEREVVMQAT